MGRRTKGIEYMLDIDGKHFLFDSARGERLADSPIDQGISLYRLGGRYFEVTMSLCLSIDVRLLTEDEALMLCNNLPDENVTYQEAFPGVEFTTDL